MAYCGITPGYTDPHPSVSTQKGPRSSPRALLCWCLQILAERPQQSCEGPLQGPEDHLPRHIGPRLSGIEGLCGLESAHSCLYCPGQGNAADVVVIHC